MSSSGGVQADVMKQLGHVTFLLRIVPLGHPTIAHRFSGGETIRQISKVPVGTTGSQTMVSLKVNNI